MFTTFRRCGSIHNLARPPPKSQNGSRERGNLYPGARPLPWPIFTPKTDPQTAVTAWGGDRTLAGLAARAYGDRQAHFTAFPEKREGSMNILPVERKIQVIQGLLEGASIRSISRMTGCHIVTILRLLREAGIRCGELMDEKMRGIQAESVQVDELWSFVGKKDRRLNGHDNHQELGSQFIFVAMEAKTKLIPCFAVGKRDEATAYRFMMELRKRTIGRYQLTTDAFAAYRLAVGLAFDFNVDYGQLVKTYSGNGHPKAEGYSPSNFVRVNQIAVFGNPDPEKISTSFIERQNLTLRMQMRRLTRLTNGFSKKLENLWSALALHYAWYNLGRVHMSLKGATPAMAAGIAERPWTVSDIMGWN